MIPEFVWRSGLSDTLPGSRRNWTWRFPPSRSSALFPGRSLHPCPAWVTCKHEEEVWTSLKHNIYVTTWGPHIHQLTTIGAETRRREEVKCVQRVGEAEGGVTFAYGNVKLWEPMCRGPRRGYEVVSAAAAKHGERRGKKPTGGKWALSKQRAQTMDSDTRRSWGNIFKEIFPQRWREIMLPAVQVTFSQSLTDLSNLHSLSFYVIQSYSMRRNN